MKYMLRFFILTAVYLLFFSPSAEAQFVRAAGGSGSEIRTTAVSNGGGGIIVTVTTDSPTLTYETGGPPASLNFTGNRGSAVLEYDDAGNLLDAFQIVSTESVDIVDSVPDGSGGLWVVGLYSGTVDFDPGPGVASETSGSDATFVANYTTSGSLGTLFVLPANVLGLGIAVDPNTNGPVVTGRFTGTVDLDPGAGTANVTQQGTFAMFLARYTAAGAYITGFGLTNAAGNTSSTARVTGSSALAVDVSGVAYVAGIFRGSIDFDPGPGTSTVSGTNSALFIAAYDNANILQWRNPYNTVATNGADDLELDGSGNLYVSGVFGGTINTSAGSFTASGASDGFVLRANTLGVVSEFWQFGGTSGTFGTDRIWDVALDGSGALTIGGQFSGTTDFDRGPGTTSRTSPSGVSYVVARYPSGSTTPDFATIKGASAGGVAARRVVPGAGGRTFAAGLFDNGVLFNPAGGDGRTSAGANDAFILGLENGALPVELAAFDAVSDGPDVVLSWQTASETNNAGFAVEQKLDVAGERGASSEWTEVG
ncbi:MAG: hypothetical protein AAF752_12950, partial [Bacteroidota bacterium]